MRTFGWVVVGLLVLGLLVGAGFALRYVLAPVEGAVEQQELVRGRGEYRIHSYEWFYDQCHAVRAYEAQLAALETERETAAERRRERIDSALAGLRGQRARAVEEYNSASRQAATRAQFRADDLPYQLDTDAKETTCDAP